MDHTHHDHGASAVTEETMEDMNWMRMAPSEKDAAGAPSSFASDETFDAQGNLNLATSQSSSDKPPFCTSRMGGGMIMYMDGFRFSLKGNQTCLNLLFPTWTLDTRAKFAGSMVAVFFMAMFVEGFSKLRHKVVRSAKRSHQSGQQPHASLLRLAVTSLHGMQAALGYILMLVTMTFSIELLLSVVLGLAVGYAVFFQMTDVFARENVDEDRHVTSNPCCEFMAEEGKEFSFGSRSPSLTGNSSLTEGLLESDQSAA